MKTPFFINQQVKNRKNQVNKNQGAKEPEMPQISFLQKAVKSHPERIYQFLSENKDGNDNQKIPGQYNLKDMGNLIKNIPIAGLFP